MNHISQVFVALNSNQEQFARKYDIWGNGIRPTLLKDSAFLNYYNQPKYWSMHKQKKANDSSQTEEVVVEVSNKSFQEQQRSTGKYLSAQLQYHNSIYIQTKKNFLQMNDIIKNKIYPLFKSLQELLTSEKLFIERLTDEKEKATTNQELQKYHKQLSKRKKLFQDEYYGLRAAWVVGQSPLRIAALAKDILFQDKNCYFYKQELKTDPKGNLKQFKVFALSKNQSQQDYIPIKFMVEIIKIHRIKIKNREFLATIGKQFRSSINTSFIKKYDDYKQQAKFRREKLTKDKEIQNAFKDYTTLQTRQVIQSWKYKCKSSQNEENLFVEVFRIRLSQFNFPLQVNLRANQTCIPFKYNGIIEDYFDFIVENNPKVVRCLKYPKKNYQFCCKLDFKVEVKYKDKSTAEFKNSYTRYIYENIHTAFSHELLLETKNQAASNQICLIYFSDQIARMSKLQSTFPHVKATLFNQIGSIPTKYMFNLKLDYSPKNYHILRQLLNKNEYKSKLSKQTFEQVYIDVVKFIQEEENRSQIGILLDKNNSNSNKFIMKHRFKQYQKRLLKQVGYFSKQQTFQVFFKSINLKATTCLLYNSTIHVNALDRKNQLQDLKLYEIKNSQFLKNSLTLFIYFANKHPKIASFPYPLKYMSHLVPIFDKLLEIYFNNEQQDVRVSKFEVSRHYLFVFITFIALLYPYSQYKNFKSDLYILRWLVQKKLPYFNDYLNRNHIGLQNLIGRHLLNFFTDLSPELTYRIWDYLISSNQKDKARVIISFTLLTYLETTQNLPLIPINQFMVQVQDNMKLISYDKQFANKFAKIADTYFSNEHLKQKKLQKIFKGNPSNIIIDDKHLRRIILGESKVKIPYEQQGRVPLSGALHQNVVSIKSLKYPLPEAYHQGHQIIQAVVFVHDLNILDNINLNFNKYWLKFSIFNQQRKWNEYIQIVEKHYFYNKSFKISGQFLLQENRDKKSSRDRLITISIVTNANVNGKSDKNIQQKQELCGFLDYGLLYKDKAYKTVVSLIPENLHNKGRTVINVSICLKSKQYQSTTHQENYQSLEALSQKLLDYDIGESSECLKGVNKLKSSLQKIKYPLDEFKIEQYNRIINRAIDFSQPQWLISSDTSIEELKIIFYHLFSQENDKIFRHQFAKYYEIFAFENNMQHVYLSQMLTKFILLANITRKKKLTYLYCVAVHYQNCYTKLITSQTLNSLIRLIYKQKEFLTACPYEANNCGKIIDAYYFESDLKATEVKKDFTAIAQDWAYVCNFKFGCSDSILGFSRNLSILRSFFDVKTLKNIQSQKECRFEIIYELLGVKYLWAVVVDSKTFQIIKRGTKFLNTFSGYAGIKYLDSTQEYLLNCENVLPLQIHKGYTYEQYTRILLANPIIRYLLELQTLDHTCFIRQQEQIQQKIKFEDKDAIIKPNQHENFNSWAIYRGQNCLESWQRCQIKKPGKVISKVAFEFDRDLQYSVGTIDILSMEEID